MQWQSDNQKFRNNGGNIKDAKLYNNVMMKPCLTYLLKSASNIVH